MYKQGQAGVQKASVTLIFDNEDKENSPLGYEQNTEITVTRQVWISGIRKHAPPRESPRPYCSI